MTPVMWSYRSSASAEAEGEVYRLSDRTVIGTGELIREIGRSGVIVVGEVHDDVVHHRLQLFLLRALKAAGTPITVGFEMFPKDAKSVLDRWVAGKMTEKEFIPLFEKYWRFPWPLYADILRFVRDNRVPSLGLNIPQGISRKVVQSGFSSLTDDELRQLPPGLTCNVTGQYREFIRQVFSFHSREGEDFEYFCEAQLLWDKSMAWYIVDYRKKHPERTLVVLTGLTHAWKRGIPDRIKEYSAESSFVVLFPAVPRQVSPWNVSSEDADYVLLPGAF